MTSSPTEEEVAQLAAILADRFDVDEAPLLATSILDGWMPTYTLGTNLEAMSHLVHTARKHYRFEALAARILDLRPHMNGADRDFVEAIRSRHQDTQVVRFSPPAVDGHYELIGGNLFQIEARFEATEVPDARHDQFSVSVGLLASRGWAYDANSARLEFGLSRMTITVKPIAGRPLLETIRESVGTGPFAMMADDHSHIERTVQDEEGCISWAVEAKAPPDQMAILTGDVMRRHDRAGRSLCPLVDFDGATNASASTVSAEVSAKAHAIHVEIRRYEGSHLETASREEMRERRLIAELIVCQCVPPAILAIERPIDEEPD